ncbi:MULTISPECIES: class I SAM-dependent methyltransferase [Actinomadura]|uniref:Class I SAM-dependent methyltransferase n=1 Tax=Actinomadura litoris TaxID=2678616 RepID=A0A7K1KY46_9ACTN|nr:MULTISPECIES: class I SAM-dependent methyltransferase [Actinomadura]MBT2209062.1 class I SAM-dependent methyltransferase [Actinomadura sp. NEAU-AAG7]MUN37121.1 class I SAM-dependent methyltransferase [Actinomadura litoris]
MRVDTSGKISLDHIYTRPDPRAFFGTLRELDYYIPELAKPHFKGLIAEYRRTRGIAAPTVLDIGCSYGINAALLKYGATMGELYDRYSGGDVHGHSRASLLARDRESIRSGEPAEPVRFLGLDASDNALSYALDAGYLDGALHADLENADPTEEQRERLAETDIAISTGCLGYVTEKTIMRIVAAGGGRPPWMAHFVLRMFPFDTVADRLAEAGYRTVRHAGLFRQRRFATPQERDLILDRLSDVGVDPTGLETSGWLYAQLYVSRPL